MYALVVQIEISFFLFTDTPATEIHTLSLHDALPIWTSRTKSESFSPARSRWRTSSRYTGSAPFTRTPYTASGRSEEHTSELQSLRHLVCRLLLEKKKIEKPPQCHNP